MTTFNNVQPTYGDRIDKAVPGMIGGAGFQVHTGNCESALIPFGRALSQGVGDIGVVLGGELAKFLGVSVKDITLGSEQDAYKQYQNVGRLMDGQIWVAPTDDVKADDPVFYNAADGTFGNATGSGMEGPIPGARYVTSAEADTPALLELLAR